MITLNLSYAECLKETVQRVLDTKITFHSYAELI